MHRPTAGIRSRRWSLGAVDASAEFGRQFIRETSPGRQLAPGSP
jgi:hypothetical protein